MLRKSGEYIYFRIGGAENFYATLNEFKERVPPRARRYYPGQREWRINATYENVLVDLFDNYSNYPGKKNIFHAKNATRGTGTGSLRFILFVAFIAVAGLWWFNGTNEQSTPTSTSHAVASTSTPLPTSTPKVSLDALVPARIARVIDGDTIDVTIDGRRYRLRYIGMDTPERDESGFNIATQRNRQLLGNDVVYLEKDVSETDRYDRLLRYVYLPDGRMVNEILVAEGWAVAAMYPPDVRYADRFRAAERSARTEELGFWRP